MQPRLGTELCKIFSIRFRATESESRSGTSCAFLGTQAYGFALRIEPLQRICFELSVALKNEVLDIMVVSMSGIPIVGTLIIP